MTPVRKKFRRRGIFLLPNLLTTAALFAGFYSIVAAVYGDFDKAGAALVAAFVWLSSELELAGLGGLALACAVTAAAGVLMVSRCRYYSFKEVNLGGRIPFAYFLGIILIFILIALDPPVVFLILFRAYAASGPIYCLWRRRALRPAGGTDNAG